MNFFKRFVRGLDLKRKHVAYRSSVLRALSYAQEPLDVEKLRKASGIANWQTALKHCLELLLDDKISGVKSSKGWTFWSKQPRRNRMGRR
ncbi:MAG: hypothetical protein ABSE39_03760 [Candidatus Bathyarchaeia archaeon]|jgi:hypothetical protein